MEKIDLRFISDREGGQQLRGYIPMKNGQVIGNSGVTVATGVDIGQMITGEIESLPISTSLKKKLMPYADRTGRDAVEILRLQPLVITRQEADELDKAKGRQIFLTLIRLYNNESTVEFKDIPAPAQTVLGSLAWHHGPYFKQRSKMVGIWNAAVYQNWDGLADELKSYQTAVKGIKNRREIEANLLNRIKNTALV